MSHQDYLRLPNLQYQTCEDLRINSKIFYKNIYDEVTEDIFDMSNVRIFKEIEKKKTGNVYTFFKFSVSLPQ